MSYRSLLVFLDQDRRAAARVGFALQLAGRLDCHVVGAAPTGLVPVPVVVSPDAISLADYADLAWLELRRRADDSAQRFAALCRAAGIASHETVADHADKAASLVQLAHCSDLVVLSQADPDERDCPWPASLVDEVVFRGARPTLLLPYAGTFDSIPARAMVAWDDGREAARAVRDALPLLRLAKAVQIVTWDESGRAGDDVSRGNIDDLSGWLRRHGVGVESGVARPGAGSAEAILSQAADFAADLIVMGAYGHARWTERVLGGATRGLLAAMTVPVLMSH